MISRQQAHSHQPHKAVDFVSAKHFKLPTILPRSHALVFSLCPCRDRLCRTWRLPVEGEEDRRVKKLNLGFLSHSKILNRTKRERVSVGGLTRHRHDHNHLLSDTDTTVKSSLVD